MKGDFTRLTHDPTKHYTRVLKQQGRVDLDADWNEYGEIQEYLKQTATRDVIGPCGIPKTGGGFKIGVITQLRLRGVAFISRSQGWVVGDDAAILLTEDGGETWTRQTTPDEITAHLWGVDFIDAEHGWVVGDDATILATEDGGGTWIVQAVPAGVAAHLRGVDFIDAEHGWVVGDNATILSTEDGGETWTRQAPPAGVMAHLWGTDFLGGRGWVVGANATIAATEDDGETWTRQTPPEGMIAHLRGVDFVEEQSGWAIGDNATILFTRDGGETWTEQTPPDGVTAHLRGVSFTDRSTGWAVGDDATILTTEDGGETWMRQSPPEGVTTHLRGVDFYDGTYGWVVGDDATILATADGGKTWIEQVVHLGFTIFLTISPGRIYVDGFLCELESEATYREQPDYPNPPPLSPSVTGRTDLVYLDVWQRHITALEDPDIREQALGGADTTTRVKTVWQVKVLEGVGDVDCEEKIEGWPPPFSGGRLSTATVSTPAPEDPCLIAPSGGFRGLENRLYRVEIHDDGDLGTATFKWSRDNGSVVFAIEEFVSGEPTKVKVKCLGRDQVLALRQGDWVEVLGDETELKGEPGTLARVEEIDEAERTLTLDVDVSAHNSEECPKVRRWDQESDTIAVTAGPIPLEDGIQVCFSGSNFKTGDHWVFAARTSTRTSNGDVEQLESAPPRGIQHHYCRLALIAWPLTESDGRTPTVTDCRPVFPPLTEICAEDVSFDNDACKLVDVETVQDALERLCAERDLRHHNKHLHGWGIVCGLQALCGPNGAGQDRKHVTVREGYAIDCEGNDLLIERDQVVDVLEGIARLEQKDSDTPVLDDNGDGEVCLTLELDEQQHVYMGLERYDPSKDSLRSLLSGTLLMDFYNDCIKVLVDFIRDEFMSQPSEETALISRAQKRITVFSNLLIQLVNPDSGRYVFLSGPRGTTPLSNAKEKTEHEILHGFYNRLRRILQSKTFCAMFDGARPFPEYPFPEHGISTIFGKGFHNRLRVHPTEGIGYTIGADNKIHVYDLAAEEMIAEVEVQNDEGIVVRDVAFSQDGGQLYAIATLRDKDTIFAIADVAGHEYTWRPAAVLCGIQLLTLATAPSIPDKLFAVGKGEKSGIFAIDLENVSQKDVSLNCEHLNDFNAFGHLVVVEEGETVFAYASVEQEASEPKVYDKVVKLNLSEDDDPLEFPLPDPLTGRDDIAVIFDVENELARLFVVADPPLLFSVGLEFQQDLEQGVLSNAFRQEFENHGISLSQNIDVATMEEGKQWQIDDNDQARTYTVVRDDEAQALNIYDGDKQDKQLVIFDATDPTADSKMVEVENTDIRLGHVPDSSYLLLSFEDSYRIGLLDINTLSLIADHRFPVQISPLAIAHDPSGEKVCALNFLSNTIMTIPASYLDPSIDPVVEPVPGSQAFLDELEAYRNDIFEAFIDLLGGFTQYLKDCLCDHFLVNCPECDLDDKIYLACVSVRGNQVHQVCNFSRRKYVKSFPTVDYWLSLVPIMPLISEAIKRFCCEILPDSFGKRVPPGKDAYAARYTGRQMRGGLAFVQTTDFRAILRALLDQLGLARGITTDWMGNNVARFVAAPQRVVRHSDVVGQPVDEASEHLEKTRAVVAQVEPYDPAQGAKNLLRLAQAPLRVAPGSRITLYEQGGVVRYYALAEEPPESIQALHVELEAHKATLAEVQALQATLTKMKKQLTRKDRDLASLRDQLQTLEQKQTSLEEAAAPEKMTEMEAELKDLRSFREKVTRFMEQSNG